MGYSFHEIYMHWQTPPIKPHRNWNLFASTPHWVVPGHNAQGIKIKILHSCRLQRSQKSTISYDCPPRTNIAPENGWLEDEFSVWNGPFSGDIRSFFGRVLLYCEQFCKGIETDKTRVVAPSTFNLGYCYCSSVSPARLRSWRSWRWLFPMKFGGINPVIV